MKKRIHETFDENTQSKIVKMEEENLTSQQEGKEGKFDNLQIKVSINDLPKVLIIYLSSFFDLDSLVHFSSTNQKYQKLFEEFRRIYFFLNQSGFVSNFVSNDLNEKLTKKDLIFKKSCYPNLRDSFGNSILHFACENENISLQIIKPFVEINCNLNVKTNYNETPLHYACCNKQISLEIMKYLIENNCELNSKGAFDNTPLHYACENENISLEIIEFLIESKCDLNSKNRSLHLTPIFYAKRNKFLKNQVETKYGKTLKLKNIFGSF